MHPIVIEIPTPWGGIPIYSYGVMLGVSLLVAWHIIMYFGTKKERLDPEMMSSCFMWTAVSALVGARLLYIFTNLDEFDTPAKWLAVRTGGLVAYGGFLGGYLGSLVFLRIRKVPLMAWADVVAPTLGSGLGFTRIGCYLFGCDFGKRLGTDAPSWLKFMGTFPAHSPAWKYHLDQNLIHDTAHTALPVHPTQLYESAIGFVLFSIGMLAWRFRKFRGQVICTLVLAYATWRFSIEFLRDDPERGGAFGLSTSQLISAALFPLVGYAFYFFRKRGLALGDAALEPVGAPAPALVAAEAGGSSSSSSRRIKPKKKKR